MIHIHIAVVVVVQEKYGGTRTYTSGTFVKGEGVTGGVEDTSDTRLVKASSSNPVTVTQTSYYYDNLSKYFENELAYNVLLSGRNWFWLASRSVNLYLNGCYFNVCSAKMDRVGCTKSFFSSGGVSYGGATPLPVVSLESDIPVDGKDTSGAWKLKIE